jgi:hypothetical protein
MARTRKGSTGDINQLLLCRLFSQAHGGEMKIELLGFTVPNFVIQKMPARPRQEGFVEAPKYALADVPAEDLAALCDRFRSEVFRKARKVDPAKLTRDPNIGKREAR